jgi:hypothetical protein
MIKHKFVSIIVPLAFSLISQHNNAALAQPTAQPVLAQLTVPHVQPPMFMSLQDNVSPLAVQKNFIQQN